MRCRYCNKESPGDFCSRECIEKYETFEAEIGKRKKIFLALLITGTILMFSSVFLQRPWSNLLLFGSVAFVGAVIFFIPFATPDTVMMVGVKRSKTMGRAAGILIIIMAIAMYLIFVR